MCVHLCAWCKQQQCVFPGAQIIDLMLLVVDVTKGVQTQTAEVRGAQPHTYHIWEGVGPGGRGLGWGQEGEGWGGQDFAHVDLPSEYSVCVLQHCTQF